MILWYYHSREDVKHGLNFGQSQGMTDENHASFLLFDYSFFKNIIIISNFNFYVAYLP